MGKARHPHDSSRPERASVRKALEAGDSKALYDALTVRQRRFAEEYVIDFNGSAAAIRAGYTPNYSDKQAYILSKHKGVAAYIDELTRSKESKIMSISPDYLIQRLTDIMNREGVRTADELRAVELAMKHLGMFIDKTEITGKDGGAIEIENRRVEEEAQSFTDKMKMLRERVLKDKEIALV